MNFFLILPAIDKTWLLKESERSWGLSIKLLLTLILVITSFLLVLPVSVFTILQVVEVLLLELQSNLS
jgi:hypothetical protein